jgi:hypothetical protein
VARGDKMPHEITIGRDRVVCARLESSANGNSPTVRGLPAADCMAETA